MDPSHTACSLDRPRAAHTLALKQLTVATSAVRPSLGRGTLRTDSRAVSPGDIFIAYRGAAVDGHGHIEQALSRGAGLIVLEDGRWVASLPPTATWIQVASSRAAWAWLAAEAMGNPQNDLTLLGVTGTNGKTSTVWMLGALLRAIGRPCLTLGTLGAYGMGEPLQTGHTTPDPDKLFPLLAQARDLGVRVVAMEVSSHALAQEKLVPLTYQAAAFTSFSRDHLDFHQSMASYLDAKCRLFRERCAPGARMVFWDGLPALHGQVTDGGTPLHYGTVVKGASPAPGERVLTDVIATDVTGSTIEVLWQGRKIQGRIPYFADHAIQNFTAALLLASAVDETVLSPKFWSDLPPVPGRLEAVRATGAGDAKVAPAPLVIVDYAHTPDALAKTLAVLRTLCRGRLILVFGCGGDRDVGKRPLMGEVAAQSADVTIISSDNPRTEDQMVIIASIAAGYGKRRPLAEAQSAQELHLEPDRKTAIEMAVSMALPTDLVVIAGKGHETYQIIGHTTLPFDDRLVAEAAIHGRLRRLPD